jgi:hypothetical protein
MESFTPKTPTFPEIVIVRDLRTEMNVQTEPFDLRSSKMAQMTSLNELHEMRVKNSSKLP